MSNFFNRKNSVTFLHIGVWAILFILPYSFAAGTGASLKNIFLHSWLSVIAMMVIFYFNYLKLIDEFLFKNKTAVFVVINILLVIFFVYLKFAATETFLPKRPNHDGKGPAFGLILYLDAFYFLIPIAVALALKSMQRFVNIRVEQKENENVRLQSELQHLKYQLQPHFFFNSLNNIYALVDLDQEKAKESIHSLSKMMRFMLYESDVQEVSLNKEIEFLNRYNDLMKLRLGKNVNVISDFPNVSDEVKIAPLLFISLVENAYKHGVSSTSTSEIQFKINVENNRIKFTSTNDNFPKDYKDESGSGIGLENLKKRLNLIYPNKHQFNYGVENGRFVVDLVIEK